MSYQLTVSSPAINQSAVDFGWRYDLANSIVKMTPAEWIAVKTNPIQRDTERHAQKAKHLLTPQDIHSIVFAARLPNGELVKLDGHTRAFLWQTGIVPQPRTITVNVIDVANIEEAAEQYKFHDSKNAVEGTPDKIAGAMRGQKHEPKSVFVASGGFSSALRIAWISVFGHARNMRARDEYEAVKEFLPEIIALDGMNLKRLQTSTGVTAAIILSHRRHGEAVAPFWSAVFKNEGDKKNGRMDAVQTLHELMQKQKKTGGSAARELCGRALLCVERWLEHEFFVSLPKSGMDIGTYLDPDRAVKRPKYRLVQKRARIAA